LALGSKFGGEVFSAEDMDILRVVARQIGPIIENIHLLNQLRQYANELELRVIERTEELYDAKERVEAILASVGDGVIVTDLGGYIQKVNSALENNSGYSAIELVGKNLFFWLAEFNEKHVIKIIQDTLEDGKVWNGELVNQRKYSTPYDILLTIAPVRDQSGTIVNYVATQRDITYRKELDRLKDIFVADVSHELRTPTTNIGLYLELLETAPEEKRADYVRILYEQSQLLRRLVEDILDLSRLAIGKTKKIDYTSVDLGLIIDQVRTAHQIAVSSKGLELNYFPNGDKKILVHGEQHYLSRVVNNLVANAIQYTSTGTVTLRTSVEEDIATLIVQDTGIGIDSDDMPHIFERFYRGKRVRQSMSHGTGLGLAIVKEIIELHGGTIDVKSALDQGSVFKITLPMWRKESYISPYG